MFVIETLPKIAIVGRPNVGKSSLFNRLINKRHAITSKIAGTTRDRIYHRAEIGDYTAILIDTGGIEYGKKENIENDVQTQVDVAIQEADLVYFVVDAKEGLTIEDNQAAEKLRRSKKEIVLIANKVDTKESDSNIPEIMTLGFGEPTEISAYHNQNIGEIYSLTLEKFKKLQLSPLKDSDNLQHDTINISFIGKPNVGKSSIVNTIIGKEKVIVSDIPGTTRDAIDTEITWNDQKFTLIDTAGLRKRGKIERGIEKISSFRALDAIERSDIVCLLIDYKEGVRKQDQHISSYALEAGKGVIIIVNKSDLMDDKEAEQNRFIRILKSRFDFLPWAPVIFTSALKRKNVENILKLANEIYNERFKKIPDEELNLFMKEITHKHLPPTVGNRVNKFYKLEQDAVNPPCFVYYLKDPKSLHFSYRRYLENEIRKRYGFNGTAIRLYFKKNS
ncbi:ribosome biogenesis GTPase Der [Candidatus Peregrinibacteria bacterium]|nr:ribosome biogenesis GTPase Der [Candidatus Peregrinibacteria bacterium]